MNGNTAFITYILEPTSGLTGGNYSKAIHCNYIKKIDLGVSDPYIQEISLNFPYVNDFKFLSTDIISDADGYVMNKIYALVQIVSNTAFDSFTEVKPDSKEWKQLDITPQISGYTTGSSFVLTPVNITSVVFKISLLQYNNSAIFTSYNLDYLNYPSSSQAGDDDILSFGESSYFFGNVATKIKADVYTTDISINLPLNQFNSTTNLTWNGLETVYISEIGIYDSNKNLVAIGKLNNPVAKDATIARTLVFALDF